MSIVSTYSLNILYVYLLECASVHPWTELALPLLKIFIVFATYESLWYVLVLQEDDERTIDEDEAQITEAERNEELAALQAEADIPIDDLLELYVKAQGDLRKQLSFTFLNIYRDNTVLYLALNW